jgi:hypothetical protein
MFRRFWKMIRQLFARFGGNHREPVLETFSEPAVHIGAPPHQLKPSVPPTAEEGELIPFSEPAVHFEVKPRRTEQ